MKSKQKLIIYYNNKARRGRKELRPESLLCKSEEAARKILRKRVNILAAQLQNGDKKIQLV